MTKVKLLSPWRRSFQWCTTLLIFFLPWVKVNGESLLRIDIANLSLNFFGQVLRIEELYLFLFFSLSLILFFLLVTLVFGRVWCGWACPQTTLNDVAEWLAAKLKLKRVNNRLQGKWWRKSVLQAGYALLAFLVAANLLWYFIEPLRFFNQLLHGTLHLAAWLTLLITFVTLYIDLAFIRRLMCSEFCPYGRIQTSLVDPGTLTLHLPDSEKARCIKCGSCVRVCPMGIDIREGFQVECINCGRCLDACRKVMAPRREQGLIRYSFGTEGNGFRALLNPRTLLIATAMTALVVVLITAVLNRPVATIKVSHSHQVSDRLLDNGQLATFFNGWINNRSQQEMLYQLAARDPETGAELQLKGQTQQITIPGGGNRRIDFVLVSTVSQNSKVVEFVLKDRHGQIIAAARAQIAPVTNE